VDSGKTGPDAEAARRNSFVFAFRRRAAHALAVPQELADNGLMAGDAGMRTLHKERRTQARAVALRAPEIEDADKVSLTKPATSGRRSTEKCQLQADAKS
jgi:hypothetical protein